MGRIFKKTTAFFSGGPSNEERLRRNFVPCPRGNGSKVINFKIFDEHELVTDMLTSGADLATELETFLKGMRAVPGLDATTVARLSAITFTVTYRPAEATGDEINRFGLTDFPIYLLTATGNFQISGERIVDLLIAHRIPLQTAVARKLPGEEVMEIPPVFPYRDLEEEWEEKDTVLGFGIPGNYFDVRNPQHRCRKVGIIKMGGTMKLNLHHSQWKAKLLSVMKHEIGHMLALAHESNTLMAADYNVNFNFPRFTPDQVWVASRALEVLTS